MTGAYYTQWFTDVWDMLAKSHGHAAQDAMAAMAASEDGSTRGWGEMFDDVSTVVAIIKHAMSRYKPENIHVIYECSGDVDDDQRFVDQVRERVACGAAGDKRSYNTSLITSGQIGELMGYVPNSQTVYISHSYAGLLAGLTANARTKVMYRANAMFNVLGIGTCIAQSDCNWEALVLSGPESSSVESHSSPVV